jgi:hypothetical protein
MTEDLSKKGTIEEMSQIENTVIDLRSKVSGELTGGRLETDNQSSESFLDCPLGGCGQMGR